MQFRVVGLLVEEALPERLAHNLADALGRHPFVLGDLVIGPALAQAGENAPPAQNPAAHGEPPLRRGNRLVFHIRLV